MKYIIQDWGYKNMRKTVDYRKTVDVLNEVLQRGIYK